MSELLGTVLEALLRDRAGDLRTLGIRLGKLYTDHGYPVDMALSRLAHLDKAQRVAVLNGALEWTVEHKRLSGASEKAMERARRSNREVMERYVRRGEAGLY